MSLCLHACGLVVVFLVSIWLYMGIQCSKHKFTTQSRDIKKKETKNLPKDALWAVLKISKAGMDQIPHDCLVLYLAAIDDIQ